MAFKCARCSLMRLCVPGVSAVLVFLASAGAVRAIGSAAADESAKPQPAQTTPKAPDNNPAKTPDPATDPNAKPAATPAAGNQKRGDMPHADKTVDEAPKPDPYVLSFTMKDIDGNDKNLEDFKGKVVLLINVASNCGFTAQYKGLEALYQSKKASGFEILGFPANNFGGQEPGTDAQIKEFCSTKYSVTFPLFSKISVKGDDIHPLYKKLTTQPAPVGGDVAWNFTKYLVDRKGNVVAKFESRVKPDDTELLRRIDELLAVEQK